MIQKILSMIFLHFVLVRCVCVYGGVVFLTLLHSFVPSIIQHCWFGIEISSGRSKFHKLPEQKLRICPGHPFPLFPLVHSLPHILLFFTFSLFPFLIRFTYFLLLSIPSLFSTRVVPLHFQARGHRRWSNLGLVCCVYFTLSVSLS